MDTTQTCDGTLPLHRCGGCVFLIVRRPSEFSGRYRILRDRDDSARPAS